MKHSLLREKSGLPRSDVWRAQNVRKGAFRGVVLAWMSLIALTPYAARACPGGLFGTAGQVLEVMPADAQAEVVDAEGRRTLVGVGALFCHGDLVRPSASASLVVIHAEAQRRTLEAGQSYRAAARPVPAEAQTLARLSGLHTPDGRLRPVPVVPEPRQIRAAGAASSAPVWPLGTLRALQALPRQKLTADLPVVLAWRGGAGPYACEAANDWGDTVRAQPQSSTVSWCVLPAALPDSTRQLRLREQRGPALTWNIRWVDWAQVPRPAELASTRASDATEKTAWAIWLWRQGMAEWKLQALAMLQQAAGEQWLAAYYRDLILSEQWDDVQTSP